MKQNSKNQDNSPTKQDISNFLAKIKEGKNQAIPENCPLQGSAKFLFTLDHDSYALASENPAEYIREECMKDVRLGYGEALKKKKKFLKIR